MEKVCPHFHVSLQSGSDGILMRMNRKYTSAQFWNTLPIYAKLMMPAVTTDIIAGFPGETEGEFAETCTFVKECRFFRIHVFPYSEREGTPAASMECRVPMKVRRGRANQLIEIGERLEREYAEQFLETDADSIV